MIHALKKLINEAALALCVLNRMQFSAPWNAERRGC
jgi:hypothetical protein